jgi:hypothetical protein
MQLKLVVLATLVTIIGLVGADCPAVIPNPNSDCDSLNSVCEYSTCSDDNQNSYSYRWNAVCRCIRATQGSTNILIPSTNSLPVIRDLWMCASAKCDCPSTPIVPLSSCNVTSYDAFYVFFRAPYRVAGQSGCPTQVSDGNGGMKTQHCVCSMYSGPEWHWKCRD